MCGAWVGVLPKLTQNPQPRYVRALSLGIAALYSSVRLEPYAVVMQTYCAATNALRKDITLPKSLLESEVNLILARDAYQHRRTIFPTERTGTLQVWSAA
ncbi:hypothetical protein N7449_002309 [Penicillium cf. viridicatum]|uniref:Uncharacterized protein n=1 Tax=Penicillium cf. viridicatum TaxID=2972119 RepID=A0A9W9MV59_9EURO|nr:hypothetical protein N7449_002309 [Penicillium cf. viridicatum]